jgi:hypothetical protein
LIAWLAAAAVLTASCRGSDSDAYGVPAARVEQLPAELVPADVLGLRVSRENVDKAITGDERLFTEAVGFYSLRRDKLLMATMQVARFTPDTPYKEREFQQSVVAQVGGSVPTLLTVGDRRVFLTTVSKQHVYLWFADRSLFQLTVRPSFEQPLGLLRELQAVAP